MKRSLRLARLSPLAPLIPLAALALALPGCSADAGQDLTHGLSSFHVEITKVNGSAVLPTPDKPLPANYGDHQENWDFTVEARTPTGAVEPFNGMVRVTVIPGAVAGVTGPGAVGRNIMITDGKVSGSVAVTAIYGPTRLWIEDIGYAPAPRGTTPACSSGKAADGGVDFPANPGCAYADDNSVDPGSYAAGVSAPVAYALPKISDVHGHGSTTPYPYQAIEVNAAAPQQLVVTRVASSGFYVSDLAEQPNKDLSTGGYNSVFAFNFSTPPFMRVCDKVSYFSGTVAVFFGFLEVDFPSWQLVLPHQGDVCTVPEPIALSPTIIGDAPSMKKLESSLVRISAFTMPSKFGPKIPKMAQGGSFAFDANSSNCDFNGDGSVDFKSAVEGACGTACNADPTCSEWTTFSARNEITVTLAGAQIQLNAQTAPAFDATAFKGQTIEAATGTLRHFSGGKLNWTVETRCPDDIVCKGAGCAPAVQSSQTACVRLRSIDDNDQGSN